MKKKVALIGLNTFENLGDQVLCDSTNYLIEQCGCEYEVAHVNQYPPIRKKNILKPNNLIYCIVCVINRILAKIIKSKKLFNKLELLAWKIRLFGYYQKALKGMDAAILAGGTIKYSNQGVNYAYEFAVKQAEKYNIPFMFNAMSIEPFDGNDSRCIRLQKVLNSNSVKVISTRDGENGVGELKRNYLYNKDVLVFAVGDPAFWASEVYKIKKKNSDKIGVGLIRADIFKMYGRETTPTRVRKFYENLAGKLTEENVNWSFFSNGLEVDQVEGERIVDSLNLSRQCIERKPKSTKELVEVISEYKCIIGARMHSQILAYALNIPMVGIDWDNKIVQFFNNSHCSKWLISEEELEAELVLKRLLDNIQYDEERMFELKNATLNAIKIFLTMC